MKSFFDKLAGLFVRKPDTKALLSKGTPSQVPESQEARAKAPRSNPYVFVEDDGTARELEADEVEYLNTKFEGGDGARPYIKSNYEQRTPDGRIGGYLCRDQLPTGIRVKSKEEATPVETPDEAIRIAQLELPISFCLKSGTRLERITDQRSGRMEFGLPGVDVSSGDFSANLTAGVLRVVRKPKASAIETEQDCFIEISAQSGRIVQFGWL